ncbi:MAG: GAF domain-containing protein [Desulfovibrionaceae bacterium]|nr:GAF domain-containing protein [Desulfovibrionaceae bacterium]
MIAQTPAQSLLALVASVFDAYSVVLFQTDDESGQSEARLSACFSQGGQIAHGASVPPGKGLVGWILRNKAPLLVDSIDQNQAFLGYYQEGDEPDIRSFMGCPVPGGGALCVDSTRAGAFAGSRQKLLPLFAHMIPQLQNLALHSDHNREVSVYFHALERMAELRTSYAGWGEYLDRLLALLKEVTDFDYAAFTSRVEGSAEYIVEGECPPLLTKDGNRAELPVNSGIVGWVFRNEEGVHNDGVGGQGATPIFGKNPLVPDFAAAICLPVTVEGCTCGVLCLAALKPHPVSPELRSFLHMTADEMARQLDCIALRYRIHNLLPRASLQRSGAVPFDPDAPPVPGTDAD